MAISEHGMLRAARPEEATLLSGLAMRSKAHWGYDEHFMAQCVDSLRVEPADIEAGRVIVITDDADRPLGHFAFEMIDAETADVAAMFIEPDQMGKGLGDRLFKAGTDLAASAGARKLMVLSDPQARAFYEKMGAAFLHDDPSDAIPGRSLPRLELDLSR